MKKDPIPTKAFSQLSTEQKKKTSGLWLLLVIVVALAIAAMVYYFRSQKSNPGSNNNANSAKPNIQRVGNITFDSNLARPGNGNLIVRDIATGQDYGVIRNADGSYSFKS